MSFTPFTLEVEFTGLCMFVVKKSEATVEDVTVVLPDCRLGERDQEHLDHTRARAHAGYLRFDAGNLDVANNPFPAPGRSPLFESVHRFSRQELDFGLSTEKWDKFQPDLPEVDGFAPTLRPRKEIAAAPLTGKRAVMRTQLKGGTLKGRGEKDEWEFPSTFNTGVNYSGKFTDRVVWTRKVTDRGGLTLTLRSIGGKREGTELKIPLKPQPEGGVIRLKIANLCCANPLEWGTLEDECPEPSARRPARPGKTPRSVVDVDFKWFYQLLLPDGEPDYKKLLKRGNLPAPRLLTADRGGQGCVGLTVYDPPR